MALLFMDGFDAADFSIKWDNTGATPAASTSTRFSTGRCVLMSSGSDSLTKGITASSQVTIGFAVTGTSWSIRLDSDAGSTTHLVVTRNTSSGLLELRRNTTVIATGSVVFGTSAWNYVEVQGTIADAGGVVTVRVNGNTTPDISFTGDTKNAGTNTTIDAVRLSGAGSFDDVYILNSTGSTHNTFLGDVRIHTLVPNADGASSQFTGSDGDSIGNYQLVDELPYSSLDYTGTSVSGQRDTYNISDAPSGIGTIHALQTNTIAAKTDVELVEMRSVVRLSGTNNYGTTKVVGASYVSYNDRFVTNPQTSNPWTVNDIASMEVGVELT